MMMMMMMMCSFCTRDSVRFSFNNVYQLAILFHILKMLIRLLHVIAAEPPPRHLDGTVK